MMRNLNGRRRARGQIGHPGAALYQKDAPQLKYIRILTYQIAFYINCKGDSIDVLLSARRIGPTGKAYGLDMTDKMLALARENKQKAGAENVDFLKGEVVHVPLPDNTVDVIISNCVINLSADKRPIWTEACRVLEPGRRFAVSGNGEWVRVTWMAT